MSRSGHGVKPVRKELEGDRPPEKTTAGHQSMVELPANEITDAELDARGR